MGRSRQSTESGPGAQAFIRVHWWSALGHLSWDQIGHFIPKWAGFWWREGSGPQRRLLITGLLGKSDQELIFVTPWAALEEEISVSLRLLQASWPNSMDVWAARSQRSLAKSLTRAHNYKQHVMNIFVLLSMLVCVCVSQSWGPTSRIDKSKNIHIKLQRASLFALKNADQLTFCYEHR